MLAGHRSNLDLGLVGKIKTTSLPIYFSIYFTLFATQSLQKIKEKREKKKWRGDLTETIGAYERLGLLELRVRCI